MQRWFLSIRVIVAATAVALLILGSSPEVWGGETPVGTVTTRPARTAGPAATSMPSLFGASDPAWSADSRGPRAEVPPVRAVRPGPAPVKFLLVRITHSLPIMSSPGGGHEIGVMPTVSKYYHVPLVAWVVSRSADGLFGQVPMPYSGSAALGWISLRNLPRSCTSISVVADLSRHELTVRQGAKVLFRTPAATGAAWSPTPVGHFFVTDRVPFSPGSALGAFAFGLSGIQPHLPPGWSAGNQLAIHGTSNPASIGTSASAGCLRIGAAPLMRLESMLSVGTPVLIQS